MYTIHYFFTHVNTITAPAAIYFTLFATHIDVSSRGMDWTFVSAPITTSAVNW
jgi:hypothetical protein